MIHCLNVIRYKFSRRQGRSNAGYNELATPLDQLDQDVAKERNRVLGSSESHVLEVSDLRKVYTSRGEVKVGVDGISFGVPENECFGLLGVNGAGKTSTFKM